MIQVSSIPTELDDQTLNFIEKGLSIAHGYYQLAPVFFWAGVGLVAWKIAWGGLAKMRGKSGD